MSIPVFCGRKGYLKPVVAKKAKVLTAAAAYALSVKFQSGVALSLAARTEKIVAHQVKN